MYNQLSNCRFDVTEGLPSTDHRIEVCTSKNMDIAEEQSQIQRLQVGSQLSPDHVNLEYIQLARISLQNILLSHRFGDYRSFLETKTCRIVDRNCNNNPKYANNDDSSSTHSSSSNKTTTRQPLNPYMTKFVSQTKEMLSKKMFDANAGSTKWQLTNMALESSSSISERTSLPACQSAELCKQSPFGQVSLRNVFLSRQLSKAIQWKLGEPNQNNKNKMTKKQRKQNEMEKLYSAKSKPLLDSKLLENNAKDSCQQKPNARSFKGKSTGNKPSCKDDSSLFKRCKVENGSWDQKQPKACAGKKQQIQNENEKVPEDKSNASFSSKFLSKYEKDSSQQEPEALAFLKDLEISPEKKSTPSDLGSSIKRGKFEKDIGGQKESNKWDNDSQPTRKFKTDKFEKATPKDFDNLEQELQELFADYEENKTSEESDENTKLSYLTKRTELLQAQNKAPHGHEKCLHRLRNDFESQFLKWVQKHLMSVPGKSILRPIGYKSSHKYLPQNFRIVVDDKEQYVIDGLDMNSLFRFISNAVMAIERLSIETLRARLDINKCVGDTIMCSLLVRKELELFYPIISKAYRDKKTHNMEKFDILMFSQIEDSIDAAVEGSDSRVPDVGRDVGVLRTIIDIGYYCSIVGELHPANLRTVLEQIIFSYQDAIYNETSETAYIST